MPWSAALCRDMPIDPTTCGTHVELHLPHECIQAGKAAVGTQAMQKFDSQALPVKFAVKIKNEYFEACFAAIHRGTPPHVGRAMMHPTLHAMHGRDKNACHWHYAPFECEVRGRKAQSATQSLTVNYAPAQDERRAQQLGGSLHFAGGQRFANPGAADTLAANPALGGGAHFESVLPASRLQHREIATPLVAKTKIAADRKITHPEPANQHTLDEDLGRHGGEAGIETQTQQPIQATSRKCLELFTQGHEPRRRRRGREVFLWRWFEHHHRSRQITLASVPRQVSQHLTVTQVHAIEITDGRDATPVPRLQAGQPTNQFHARTLGLLLHLYIEGTAIQAT